MDVDVGFAMTAVPVVALSPVEGLHEYVDAPLAVSVAVCCPKQIVAGGTEIMGRGFTVMIT